jgi:hypothetical protein
MADQPQKRPHFILEGVTDTEQFRRTGRGEKPVIPQRDRGEHGGALLAQIAALEPEFDTARAAQDHAGFEGGFGLQVEFESFPDIHLAFESLARERSGIELLNVRHDEHKTYATVFVPDGKLEHFERLIRDYLSENRDKAGRVRDHKTLINAIERIRSASIRALWTDDPAAYPTQNEEVFWWEVWLPIREDRAATIENFRRLAEVRGMVAAPGNLEFPERTVLLVRTSASVMRESIMTLNSIAELRRGKETAEFFDSLRPGEQPEWLKDLLERSDFSGPEDNVPYVCILDTGINRGHPLIAPALAEADLHTVEPSWGTDDSHGHGTAMAGLAIHSAEWTDSMLETFLPGDRQVSKADYAQLVRHCGFGVLDLDRAQWSASNSLSMVIQTSLHPFKRVEGKPPALRDMNLHRLPWPLTELEALGETPVEMRVTLSYFIEPNPSERGFRSRYRYESHGLRFDVKRAHESERDFRARINAAARDEEEGTRRGGGGDDGWVIGTTHRHKGSLHSDIWRGTAVDLASRGVLAVYPALGWWKTRPRLERYDNEARYTLIVSIRAPQVEVDLYTPIANQIGIPIDVEI